MPSGKMEFETLGKLLLLLAFLIVVLVIMGPVVKIIFNEDSRLDATDKFKGVVCWSSNVFIDSISMLVPQACGPVEIEKPVDKAQLSNYMRWCWWMYGRGGMDLGPTSKEEFVREALPGKDNFYVCYAVRLKEDVKVDELFDTMKKTKRGEEKANLKIESSDWNYVQAGSVGNTMCIDEETKGTLYKYDKDKGGPIYYISFFDCRDVPGVCDVDRLLMSQNSRFGDLTILPWDNMDDYCWEAGINVAK
jgi:hypothetical protein